jgi:hypothetical protein
VLNQEQIAIREFDPANLAKRVLLTWSNVKVDGSATPVIPMMLYNGATYDLQRGNTQGTLLASAARTSSTSSPDQTNHNAKGVVLILNVTAVSGTGGLVVRFYGKDPVSGGSYQLSADPPAITAAGVYAFELYPAISSATGSIKQAISSILPRTWMAQVATVDATSYTYSLSNSLIL